MSLIENHNNLRYFLQLPTAMEMDWKFDWKILNNNIEKKFSLLGAEIVWTEKRPNYETIKK